VKTYLQIFWNSIRGFQSYQLLFRNPLKVTLIYWFLFCVVLSTVIVSIRYARFSRELPVYAQEASKNLPEFSFKDGQMITPLPTPMISNTNACPIILDPDDKIAKPPDQFTNSVFQIGKSKIKIWMKPGTPPWILSIKDFPNGRVDGDYILELGKQGGYVMAPFLLVVMILLFYVIGLLQALFFATLVSFLEKTIQPSFTFEEMLNISTCALTPGAVIVTVYWAWGIMVIPYDLIYFFSYIVFHVMASGACRRSMLPPEQDEY